MHDMCILMAWGQECVSGSRGTASGVSPHLPFYWRHGLFAACSDLQAPGTSPVFTSQWGTHTIIPCFTCALNSHSKYTNHEHLPGWRDNLGGEGRKGAREGSEYRWRERERVCEGWPKGPARMGQGNGGRVMWEAKKQEYSKLAYVYENAVIKPSTWYPDSKIN